ncbi:MAG: NADH-quinone oxidoreductase subunit A [Vicinamibacteria bacterium]
MTEWAIAINFIAVFLVVMLLVNSGRFLGPKPRHEGDADKPYETGLLPIEVASEKMTVLYYRFAVLFVVFDVDLVFLLPWVSSGRPLALLEVIAVTVFVAVLGLMLVYFWRKGVLDCR